MKFEEVLPLLLAGAAVVREGDDIDARIYLVKGSIAYEPRHIASALEGSSAATSYVPLKYFEAGDINTVTRLPRFDARDTNGNTVTGWLPTATDLLADDWIVLNEADDPT
jgi:hypothetical protein